MYDSVMTTVTTHDPAGVMRGNLRRLLQREWLSQREAATRIGVSYKWLRRLCHSGLERKDRRTASELEKVASFFGVRVSDFWLEEVADRFDSISGQTLIKWTGSKRKQAEEIVQCFPLSIATYYEPFVGGGSVLYCLLESDIAVQRYRCSDTCKPLIELWRLVKDDPRRIIDEYEALWARLRESGDEVYYSTRDEFNDCGDPALFFFLLRTCRNGLVRFNESGRFTSAFHHGRNGMTPNQVKGVVEDWATKLREHNVRFYVRDYRRIESDEGDLLYLDPPYAVGNRVRFYSGQIDFNLFFRWLSSQRGDYLLSLNGFSDDEDCRVNVPADLYDQHVLVDAGTSSFSRLNGGDEVVVRDSLYVRVTQDQRVVRAAIEQTENPAATFRQNIRRLLDSRSMTQKEAADQFDISYKSMRRFSHQGLLRPDKRTRGGLERLARHFGLTLADLWKPKAHKQASPPDADNILNNLGRYCNGRFIDIPMQHWRVLGDEAALCKERKQEIAGRLAEVFGRYDAPCPQVSEKRRTSDFELFLNLPDEREAVDFGFGDVEVGAASKWSRLGLRFLNSFGMLESRIQGGHRSSPSLLEAWTDRDRRTSIMRAALSLKKHLSEATAFESASMKIHVPANFRPTAARAIYNDLGNGGTVLDFSAGYGGRFLGFLGSSCRQYIGIDPNTVLRPSYESMFKWIESNHEHDKSWEMVWKPAEDVDYSPWRGKVDLIFTSPPYFDLERYSNETTQSSARFPSLSEWLEGFLFETLRRSVRCLKLGGHLALNIADNATYDVEIIEPVIEFARTELRLELQQVVPMLLSSKPGKDRQRVGWGRKAEPILIFQ